MLHSESMKEIAPALVKAWKAITPAIKDATNPHYKSNYATLGAVLEAVRHAFIPNDLCLVQSCEASDDGAVGVVTTALHTSGEWVSCVVRIPLEKPSANGVGSAISYGRRYGAGAIAGLWSEEDDDGTVATQYERPATVAKAAPNGQPPKGYTPKPAPKAASTTHLCPQCGGPSWDNRGNKKNPKGPDFTCKDKECKNEKGYTTGWWEPKDEMAVTAAARPFDQMPEALDDEGPDGLPF